MSGPISPRSLGHEEVGAVGVGDDVGGEADVAEEAEPGRAAEQAVEVAVVLDTNRAVGLAEEQGEVYREDRVARVWVPGPLQVAQAPFGAVVAAVRRLRRKGLLDAI